MLPMELARRETGALPSPAINHDPPPQSIEVGPTCRKTRPGQVGAGGGGGEHTESRRCL